MQSYRRGDTGAPIQARQVSETETISHGKVQREMLNAYGQVMRNPFGFPLLAETGETHQVTAAPGEWLVFEADAAWVMTDAAFQRLVAPAPAPVGQQAQDVADAAVWEGDRYTERVADGQDAERAQLHAAIVLLHADELDAAGRILQQRALVGRGHPSTVTELLERAEEYVDGATLHALQQERQLRRLQQENAALRADQGG